MYIENCICGESAKLASHYSDDIDDYTYFVECSDAGCNMSGPARQTTQEAVEIWNTIMRRCKSGEAPSEFLCECGHVKHDGECWGRVSLGYGITSTCDCTEYQPSRQQVPVPPPSTPPEWYYPKEDR